MGDLSNLLGASMQSTASIPSESPQKRRPRFDPDSGFFKELKREVSRQLADGSVSGSKPFLGKVVLIIAWYLLSLVVLLATDLTVVQIIASVSLGLSAAGIGFNVFHDANHGAFPISKRSNETIAILCCVLLGASRFMWHQKHHVFHHRYTNLHTWDDDIETREFLRLSPDQPFRPWHRFQFIYWPVLYAMATIEWIYIKDFKQYFSGSLNPYLSLPKMSAAEHWEFWMTKAVYVSAFLVLPIAALGFWPALLATLVFHAVFGLVLTSVFQLAHMNDLTAFPGVADDGLSVEDEWAMHQLRTTADFAHENRFAAWYFGGLNFQIEHHLFPSTNHKNYPAIAKLVASAAERHGLPYHIYPTWGAALRGHIRSIGRLSRAGN